MTVIQDKTQIYSGRMAAKILHQDNRTYQSEEVSAILSCSSLLEQHKFSKYIFILIFWC